MAGQAAVFQEQFVQNLTAGAFSYASIEAAITSFLLRDWGTSSLVLEGFSSVVLDIRVSCRCLRSSFTVQHPDARLWGSLWATSLPKSISYFCLGFLSMALRPDN